MAFVGLKFLLVLIVAAFATAQVQSQQRLRSSECTRLGGTCEPLLQFSHCKSGESLPYSCTLYGLRCCKRKNECEENGGVCEPFYFGSQCKSGIGLNYSCNRTGAMCCAPSM
nr:uncharacterized protein LOC128670204 isoform X2 [Plodia interpunctella]